MTVLFAISSVCSFIFVIADIFFVSKAIRLNMLKDWITLKRICKILTVLSTIVTAALFLSICLNECIYAQDVPLYLVLLKAINNIWAFVVASVAIIVVFWKRAKKGVGD